MSTFENVRHLVQFVLRRRRLLFVPLLLMIPVSIAFALLMPPRFQARSLAQFMEIEIENPLTRTPAGTGERLQDRISALRALIRSDAVLGPVVDADRDSTTRRIERLSQLRDAISVEGAGGNLIEFRLSGSPAQGLGARLDRVMSAFLQTYRLVAPQQSGARLLLIDPPRDPERPMTGRSVIVGIGVLAGLIVGIILAILAETMDRRIRTEADLRRIPDLPAVLRLPQLTQNGVQVPLHAGPHTPIEAPLQKPRRTFRRLAMQAMPILFIAVAAWTLKDHDIHAAATGVVERIRRAGLPGLVETPGWWRRSDQTQRTDGG